MRKIEYRESTFEEMDTGAILARCPQVCAVDEFPHTNVPGSARAKRWEDVQVLLDAGIHVLTTMNIQHLESLNDQVRHITGIRVRETIPDWASRAICTSRREYSKARTLLPCWSILRGATK